METAIVPLQSRPKVKLVLNRGQEELESATIAVQWFLSEEAIAEKPTHILIIDQTEAQFELAWYHGINRCNRNNNGRRYVSELTDAVKFLTLYSTGIHHISAYVFAAEDSYHASRWAARMHEAFERDIIPEALELDGHYVHAAIIIDVPKELFVQRPQSGWARTKYDYVNSFFAEGPVDECAFEKRQYFAFTLGIFFKAIQLTLNAAWSIIVRLYRFTGASYVLVCALTVLFFGYRPKPIRRELKMAWQGHRDWDESMKQFKQKRLWSEEKTKEHPFGEQKFMPIAPSEAVTLLLVFNAMNDGLQSLISPLSRDISPKLGAIIWWTFMLGAAIYFIEFAQRWFDISGRLKKLFANTSTGRAEYLERSPISIPQETSEDRRLFWMRSQLSIQSSSAKNGELAIAKPPSTGGRLIQRFTVNYYQLKARLCRPFSD